MPTTLLINGVSTTIAVEDTGGSAITEAIDQEGPTASVIFQCAYANRYTLIKGLMGTVIANGRQIVRVPPYQYPPSPNLYCQSISNVYGIKARRDTSGWLIYDTARLTANFAVPKWQFNQAAPGGQNDPSGQPWTITKTKTSAEVFTPPGGSYYVGPFPGGKPAEESSIGVVRPRTEISITRKFMPFLPLNEIQLLAGKVNQDTFIIGNRGLTAGMVLFVGANSEPSNDPAGNPTQDIEYTFMANDDYDWNTFQAKDGTWQALNTKADGSGSKPFASGDFSLLP